MQSKIQAAFQQDPALANVTVSATGNTVELSGTAASKKDKKKAEKLAKENANGAKVVDNIQVGGGSNSTTPQH
jgi:osmotically-inducible protein OsmY